MGFLEKVKNMFTEEVEDDEVKVEKVDKVKKEIIASFNEEPEEISHEDEPIFKEEAADTKPVFFDDDDFEDLEFSRKEEIEPKKEKEEKRINKSREDKYIKKGNYKEMMKESFDEPEEISAEEKKIFKPTPIISPIYGILDKNYHKEDIVSKNDKKNGVKSEPLVDQIRNKAYGTLEDELEDTLFGKDSVLAKSSDSEEIIEEAPNTEDIDTMTEDISKELDDLLLKKEKSKSKKADKDDDFLDFIDSTLYKDDGEEE